MLAAALLAAAVAMLLVRLGWAGRRGAAPAGWVLATAALGLLVWQDGAWGLATGVVVGMAAALALVLHAGWTSPARTARAPRQAPAIAIPRLPGDIARRLAVFALTVPVAFAAAQWLAFAAQSAARARGADAADALALMLFLQPLLWGVIVVVQMTRAGPMRMIAAPLVAAMMGGVLWSIA
jgi:hypothetical protein